MNDGDRRPDRRKLFSFFIPHLGIGGVEKVTVNLASEFARRGYESHVVVARATGSMITSIPDEVLVVDLGAGRTGSSLLKLAAYLAERKPAALVSSKTHANVLAFLARIIARADTRIILCEHSRFQFEQAGGLRDRFALTLAARLYPRADQIVAVSPDIARACSSRLGLRPELVRVIPNPVVTPDVRQQVLAREQHSWLRGDPFLYLGVGRLVPEKGFDGLIRAFYEVSKDDVNARLLILGEGPIRKRLEGLVSELELSNRVQLPGTVSNPLPFMRDAGAFVLSSVSEGFPMVLVEAMLAGAPVIATECSEGVRDVLNGGEYGTLVPVSDTEALAEAMVSIARSERRDTTSGRSRAEEYSVEKIASLYEDLLVSN
jgi:glycosyltransferase involved in cell wall biosynthesis